ncbi:RNA polymerase sigma factor [Pseudomaricurvus sp.]|uniref:RNA polymerase sigma factor n=1 Tax=Pseudomaricurvus sp. TaxID=2004510 RepID=UPI003F6B017D
MPSISIPHIIDDVYRTESRRILATLIRLLNGNFDLAEEALHDAFMAALSQWSKDGVPDNPRAWLVTAGRFKAIDRLRKRTRFDAALGSMVEELTLEAHTQNDISDEEIEDDSLRLIFTCCHPELSAEARTALTLREVCGLTTEEIAAAFLVTPTTLAQRIVRAKNKIRDAAIPYEVPAPAELPERLDSVLQVIYLVFNEGYSASTGDTVTRHDLSSEAIRLGRLLLSLLPDAEVMGLLALMLLHDSRRLARTAPSGDLILLDEQDRNLWDRGQIEEGCSLVVKALGTRRFGPYSLQAAIAAVHAEAPASEQTDWSEVVGLYDVLLRVSPSPVVELNRAVAIAMRDGPQAGLVLIEGILQRGKLTDYHLAYAAQADLYRRLDQRVAAGEAYQRAYDLAQQEPERRFLQNRLTQLEKI